MNNCKDSKTIDKKKIVVKLQNLRLIKGFYQWEAEDCESILL